MAAPRTREQRILDTRRRLEQDIDAWVATSNGARPWLIPLSFLWYADRLVFATDACSPTASNIRQVPQVRVALGHSRDVVMVDGVGDLSPSSDLAGAELAAYRAKHGSDPRTWADTVIRVAPVRIQAWREENELAARALMKDRSWLALP